MVEEDAPQEQDQMSEYSEDLSETNPVYAILREMRSTRTEIFEPDDGYYDENTEESDLRGMVQWSQEPRLLEEADICMGLIRDDLMNRHIGIVAAGAAPILSTMQVR